ncbi:MAG TPA: hypothetical protein VG894_11150 [Bauldia sp.]|nr:hypothetical protein [Bauldia sp.]
MRRSVRAVLALWLLAGAAAPSVASEYPYSGYYTVQPRATDSSDAALACAFGFTHQRIDGGFVTYHVDLDTFRNRGEVRYVEYAAGHCRIDVNGLEACTVDESADAGEIGAVYYDVATDIADDAVDVTYFDRRAQAVAFARHTGSEADGTAARFFRCLGFSDATLRDALGNAMSTLTLEQRGVLTMPEFTDANRALMRDILAALAAHK